MRAGSSGKGYAEGATDNLNAVFRRCYGGCIGAPCLPFFDSKPVSRVELKICKSVWFPKFSEADCLSPASRSFVTIFPSYCTGRARQQNWRLIGLGSWLRISEAPLMVWRRKFLMRKEAQKAILSKYADGLIRDWRNEMTYAAADAATRAAEKAVVKPISKATDAMAKNVVRIG